MTLNCSHFTHIVTLMLSSSLIKSADDHGTVSWFQAIKFAEKHDWFGEFLQEYDDLAGERIDVGELLSWAGY